MRYVKKSISFLLALCLLVSTLAVTAFADADENADMTVTVMGDSISTGFGLKAYDDRVTKLGEEIFCDGERIEGAYGDLLGKMLADFLHVAVDVNMDGRCAWRTSELLYVLNGGYCEDYVDEPYAGNWFEPEFFLSTFGLVKGLDDDAISQLGKKFIEDIEKSDLVTLNFGPNDIFTYSLVALFNKWEDFIFDGLFGIDLSQPDTFKFALDSLFEVIQNSGEDERLTILSDLINGFNIGLARYEKNMRSIIGMIHGINPDARVAVIGMRSPFISTIQIGDLYVDLVSYLDPYIAQANGSMYAYCAERDYCTYVDVAGTVTFGLGEVDFASLDFNTMGNADIALMLKGLHPTGEGHTYMADKLYRAVLPWFIAPTDVIVASGALGKPKIEWNEVDAACGYVVYRSLFRGMGYHAVKTVKGTTATDLTALPGLRYFYKVATVINMDGPLLSAPSETHDTPFKTSSLLDMLKWVFSVK